MKTNATCRRANANQVRCGRPDPPGSAACAAVIAKASIACVIVALAGCLVSVAIADEKTEHFDKDPGWDRHNNRAATPQKRTVKQDFGFSKTAHAGGKPGEIGGFITAAAEPAYYARRLDQKSLNDPLSASGKLICAGRKFHVLLGFFNSKTVNEWRTANSISIRLQGRGDVFFAYVEYATSRWRAGGDTPGGFATIRDPKRGRMTLRGFRIGEQYDWSVKYDPAGDKGNGQITVTIGNETSICNISPGHRADAATFDRFGLMPVLKSADDGGEVWFDDVAINGERDDFNRDPGWEGKNNRKTHETTDIRPQFDFGYSPTHFAGGLAKGELGGLVFRGDCRYPARMGCYGDRLETLTLDKPLRSLRQDRASPRRQRQYDAAGLLSFGRQHAFEPVARIGLAQVFPRHRGGRAEPRGLSGLPGLSQSGQRPGECQRRRPAAHPA